MRADQASSSKEAAERAESIGKVKLDVSDKAVDKGSTQAQPSNFTLLGDGLCVGYDRGHAVSDGYTTPGEFEGARSKSSACRARRSSASTLRGWRPRRWRWIDRQVSVAGQVRPTARKFGVARGAYSNRDEGRTTYGNGKGQATQLPRLVG